MTTQDISVYNEDFYSGQRDDSKASARKVLPLVVEAVGPVGSVLDVGCGVGSWLSAWQELGADDVLGVDGPYVTRNELFIDPDRFVAADLTQPYDPGRRFDLTMSVEVAEHLDERYADLFVATLCGSSDIVLFSAAVPGQGGTHHVNERWPSYWQPKFAAHGFEVFDVLRGRIWRDPDIEICYRQNVLLYARGAAADRLRTDIPAGPLDLLHPEAWEWRLRDVENQRPTLRQLVSDLPRAARAAAEYRRAASRPRD